VDVEELMGWSDVDDIFQQEKDIAPPYRMVISHLSMRFHQQRFFVTEEGYIACGMNNVDLATISTKFKAAVRCWSFGHVA
jgi:hypothetical protein